MATIKTCALIATLFLCHSYGTEAHGSISIKEMSRRYGVPVAIASDVDVEKDQRLLTVTLYGVNQRISKETTAFVPGQVIVFCRDPRFVREVKMHLDDIGVPPFAAGSTMFASLFRHDTKLDIFRVTKSGYAESQFSGYAIIIYLKARDRN